ncbi:MAG: SAM-dependent methyltransferase [Bacteroidota bacterium]
MEDFLSQLQNAIDNNELFKLTLSKPRSKRSQLRNIFIRPILLSDEIVWNATLRYQTNDQTKNYSSIELVASMTSFLKESFFYADLFFSDKKITLLQSKKGNTKVLLSKENHEIEVEAHDHIKRRFIPENTPYLHNLGISSSKGKVYGHAQDKFKQINKFVELVSNLIKDDTSIASIMDMGSGKGYLTFSLHDYLSQKLNIPLKTTGIEIREDLVQKCNAIAEKNQLNGLSFQLGSIEDVEVAKSDMVIALHACDIATDMAIAKGIEAEAKYIVVAPCCHKQIRRAMQKTDSKLNSILKYGILKERQAEMITDTIRALLLETQGYDVNVFEFISSEHTGKNIMLTAKKTDRKNKEALFKINDLKKEFGIEYHYLEKLLN